MTKTQLAYIAGFFDGEGSITIAKHFHQKGCLGPVYTLRIQVTGTDPRPIRLIQKYFGGSIMKRTNTGPRNKPLYQLCICSRGALRFLEAIGPYLLIKKELAIVGIEFQSKRMTFSRNGPRTPAERNFMEKCRRKVLQFNLTHTKKGGKRRW